MTRQTYDDTGGGQMLPAGNHERSATAKPREVVAVEFLPAAAERSPER
jgi:hypothetical protein